MSVQLVLACATRIADLDRTARWWQYARPPRLPLSRQLTDDLLRLIEGEQEVLREKMERTMMNMALKEQL